MAEEKGNFTTEALPTRGGTYSAWQPEYQGEPTGTTPDGWFRVPTERAEHGIPGSPFNDGLNVTIGMCSFAQANALAWMYAAAIEAKTGRHPAVRVTEYRVHYDIKCYRAADGVAPTGEGQQ